MMTRRFWAFLLGAPAAAQTPPQTGHRIARPRNGHCPVCGHVAKPYSAVALDAERGLVVDQSMRVRRVDCEHCGNTFRQWAEGREPKQ